MLHVLAPMQHGGLERVVSMMSAAQREIGVHVAAIVHSRDAQEHSFVTQLRSQNVEVTSINVDSRRYLHEYRLLRDLIARLQPQIVHSHGYRPDVIAVRAAHAAAAPAVSTVHGFTGGDLRNRLYEFIQRRALRRADAVIAVSPQIIERLTASGVDRAKIFHVANGFAPAELSARDDARRVLNLSPGERVVGWVGRLSREKGVDIMLEALALVDKDVRLAVIGDGPERDPERRRAEKLGVDAQVSWLGAIAGAAALFPAFDAFVLSSRTEGTPISLFEAMQARVPIVTTAVGNIPNVVSQSEALLVEAESPAAIAAALRSILADGGAARVRAEGAARRLASEFGIANWMSSIQRVYEAARTNYNRTNPASRAG